VLQALHPQPNLLFLASSPGSEGNSLVVVQRDLEGKILALGVVLVHWCWNVMTACSSFWPLALISSLSCCDLMSWLGVPEHWAGEQ
jgi:hypothetical protein